LLGCNNPGATRNAQTTDQLDTVGYYAARELKGLYEFILNEITTKDLKKIEKHILKETPKNNYLEGYISIFGLFHEIKEEDSFHKRDWCDNVRKFETCNFFIGDIEISSLSLTFFNDTLLTIECHPRDKLKEAFIHKYGKGKDKSKPTKVIKRKNKDILESLTDITWENETVRAQYYYEFFELFGQQEAYNYFKIALKDTVKINAMRECNRLYEEQLRIEKDNEKKKYMNKI
jgi:hypothetical protein